MADRNLVGRCGLCCGACSIYRAYKDGGEYHRLLAEWFKCSPWKVRCEGCTALRLDCWGNDCKIVQCLKARKLEHYHQCEQYKDRTSEKHENLALDYLEDGEDIRANLKRIRNGETEEWLRKSGRKSRCPACGKPLPVTRMKRQCYDCGVNISDDIQRGAKY